MRRLALALLAAGFVAFAGPRFLRADDPAPAAPLSAEEQARVKQLIENLGSDDFRVREAASKELTEIGARARPALEDAQKSTVPEVRFRADQILRRIVGARLERRLSEGDPVQPRPPTAPGLGGGRGFSNEEYARLLQQIEEQFKALHEQADKGFGQGGFGFGPGGNSFPGMPAFEFRNLRSGGGRFRAEGADLHVTTRSARLSLSETAPDGSPLSVTYEGKTIDVILAAHPELRDRPGVANVVEQAKEAAAAKQRADERGLRGGPTLLPRNSVVVTVEPGHASVTISEAGPDGKSVQKTYTGKDLDEIKREHPEIADRIGNVGGSLIVPGMPGKPNADEDGEDEEGDESHEATATATKTGPFGLGLGRLDDSLRQKTNLAEGAGLVILAVRKGSDAEAAGLRVGDVVTAVDGSAVRAERGLAEQVQAGRAKGSLVFEVLRDGKAVTLPWKK